MPLPIDVQQGLTEREAAERLLREGPNELEADAPPSLLRAILAVLREPMLLLLLGAGAIYLVLGDRGEALTLLFFVGVVISITLVQERKTEHALTALRDLSSPRALVVREGRRRRVAAREVVRGDVLVLSEGDRVPADAALLGDGLVEVDESMLTGESVSVSKRGSGAKVFSGTLVVRGQAMATAVATGRETEMGRIGKALASVETSRTPLQQEVARVVRTVALTGAVLCAALVLMHGLRGNGWLEGLLAGIALAMAILPEEFPVVLTVFMAIGAWRISKSRVLVRRLPAVEALGSATVLCSDKTGTLTENRMRIARLQSGAEVHEVGASPLPEAVHEVVEYGILASARDPFDPMERAFHALGNNALRDTTHLHGDWQLVREYPLSIELLAMAHVWRSPDGSQLVVAAKGAIEAIVDLCHVDDGEQARILAAATAMGADGLRVLGVARAYFRTGDLPPAQHDFDFEFVGLVGLADPVREGVPAAVAECATAGVRVLMITGDAPETARAIGRAIGLPDGGSPMTGDELDAASDAQLAERLREARVFARISPQQKMRLVQALRERGEVVAMTGDGVNDAPALKAAHIGVAMGGRGTDVAREAASLIVTDDDFTSIVAAIRLGRRIQDNLQRAMAYVVAVHVPIAGLALIPLLLGWPLVLFPVHIVFLELVIDPACSVAFEAEPGDPESMRRPPRPVGAGLFGRRVLWTALVQGACLLTASMAVFWFGLRFSASESSARALAFAALVAGNVTTILVTRSWTRSLWEVMRERNLASWAVVVGASAMLGLVLEVPFLRELFHFGAVGAGEVGLAVLAGCLALGWFEVWKWAARRRRERGVAG